MITTYIEETNLSPPEYLAERELDMIVLKLGSLLSILQNKKTNQAKLLIALIQSITFRNCALQLADIDNFQELVNNLIERYPTLCKSKIVTIALTKRNSNGQQHK